MEPDERSSSVNDDISNLVNSLRQAGTERELLEKSSAVDTIVSATTIESTSMTPRFTRKARIASFVAAGIIGFGGVAAAGPAVMDQIGGDDTPETVVDETVTTDAESATTEPEVTTTTEADETVTTEPEPELEVTTTTDVETTTTDVETTPTTDVAGDADEDGEAVLVDDPDTEFDETECAEGNHGKTVSSVARTAGRTSEDVVDAAQSSCGKDDKSDDGDEETEDSDSDSDADADDSDDDGDADADADADADDSDDRNAAADDQGRSNGNGGNGNANGNGGNANGNGNTNGNSGNGNGNGGGNRGNK
jgi:hypothetical protein